VLPSFRKEGKKRGKIAAGKKEAQNIVNTVTAELVATKEQYKSLSTLAMTQRKEKRKKLYRRQNLLTCYIN
jgi:hypothetical protein